MRVVVSGDGIKKEAEIDRCTAKFGHINLALVPGVFQRAVGGIPQRYPVPHVGADLQGADIPPFVDLVEEADALVLGTPTINGDAVKPVWDLLSSLVSVKLRDKLGAAFGSYGWSGEAVGMVEDRLRGLKLRVPLRGVKLKLIPTDDELDRCRAFGGDLALHLTGRAGNRVVSMEELKAVGLADAPLTPALSRARERGAASALGAIE